jgi:hypothetical protein
MLASDVLTRAQETLKDAAGVRWTQAELLRYITDGQREVVVHKPDATAAVEVLDLVPGTAQTTPATVNRLLSVIRNMGVDGLTPGAAISLVARGVLDTRRPGWHSDRASRRIDHYVFDDRTPKSYFVYPPAPSPAPKVEAMVSKVPVAVTTTAQTLTLDDMYLNALGEYVLYRSFMKDADGVGNMQRAMAHYETFAGLLGMKTSAGLMFSTRSSSRDTRGAAGTSPAG